MMCLCECCYKRFAFLDSTACCRGFLLQSNTAVEAFYDTHKVVMDRLFCGVVCGKKNFVE